MKKTYAVEVCCANCANLMEAAAGKVEGVKSVKINFLAQKMLVDFTGERDTKEVMQDILAVCAKVDDDVTIEF